MSVSNLLQPMGNSLWRGSPHGLMIELHHRRTIMRRANELVIERESAQRGIQESAAAPIKAILFAVHDDDELETRLQAALSLARACSAHLQLVQVIPLEAYTVVDTYGGAFVSGEIVEALEEQAAKLRNQL